MFLFLFYFSPCCHLSDDLSSVCGQNGQTPLMLAAEQGSLEIVQELVRRGANVNLDDVVSKSNAQSVFLTPHSLETCCCY